MPQRKFFVATGILVFDFELFIGVRYDLLGNDACTTPVKLDLDCLQEFPRNVIITTCKFCLSYMLLESCGSICGRL